MRFSPLLLLALVGCVETPSDDTPKTEDSVPLPSNSDPAAEILSPADGTELREGASLTLTAQVDDEETASEALTVAWTSTLQGALTGTTTVAGGVATTIVSDGLSEGAHTLILSVADEDGGTASDQVNVTVVDNGAPTVTIASPTEGDTFAAGETVEVIVQVTDDADDADELVLSWGGDAAAYSPPTTPDASGEAGFYMTNVVEGTRTIRVTVTDSDGGSDTEEILFVVIADADDDGYPSDEDCDDGDPSVHPGATEVCDGLDQDCDGREDEDAEDALSWYADVDGDGWGDADTITLACDLPAGHADNGGDCDDGVAGVNPDAIEVCDTLDNDCNGLTDESTATGASTFYADTDADGYGSATSSTRSCSAPAGYVSDATDCDDRLAAVNPGAAEVCDDDDNDCDGDTDEDAATDARTWYADTDGDGYGAASATDRACTQPSGYVSASTDCDDTDRGVNPAAAETCDGEDDDCDGAVDDSATDGTAYYDDDDGDGYGDPAALTRSCTALVGKVTNAGDCNDATASASPADTEYCDGIDNDCDGVADEASAADADRWYRDADTDGYGASTGSTLSCTAPSGYVALADDCDDTLAAVHPGATETCDGDDNDCDGTTDESDATGAATWYRDADADGYGTSATSSRACTAPTGYVATATDCNDGDRTAYPGASETCDSVDDDCDGVVDDNATDGTRYYDDDDGDGYGDPSASVLSCSAVSGKVTNAGDCNDATATASPADTETCDGIDNDCDGTADESAAADARTWYRDADGDLYGATASTSVACTQPTGYVATSGDCSDSSAATYPGAPETCDSADNDCDGATDEGATDPATWYRDVDGDGYGNAALTSASCTQPSGYVSAATDCNDSDDDIRPGAVEVCDLVDNNCDGVTDTDATVGATWYRDNDGDGYGTSTSVTSCTQPVGYADEPGDCNDTTASAYPGGAEACDSIDNDCDGSVDEELPTWYRDADRDGYGNASVSTTSCTAPANYVSNDDDCDDGDVNQNPGEIEVCGNSSDDDCDGLTDDSTASDATTWYADLDDDGYGDLDNTRAACTLPSGYVTDTTDCDDTDADVYPGALERCDGADNDCDGTSEEGFSVPGDYSTISAAVSAASAGDVICVDAGNFYGPITINKDVTVEGAGPDETLIDVNGGRITMTAGRLIGVSLWGGNQSTGSAMTCSSGDIYLEDVLFESNQCESHATCAGVLYLTTCTAELVDVAFQENDISPAAGTITGGLIYANGSTITSTGLDIVDNDILASSTMTGGVYYATGGDATFEDTTITGNLIDASTMNGGVIYVTGASPDFTHVYMAENTISPSTLYGGFLHAYLGASPTFTWLEILENTVTASSAYGGLVYLKDSARPTFRQFIVAGNNMSVAWGYGVLFNATANARTSGTTSTYSTGYLIFGDISGNTITQSTGTYGAIFYGEYAYYSSTSYASYHSTGWDLDMVNVVDNATSGAGGVSGSVYYDTNSSYSLNADWDYCNVYNNTGTDFYNYTDPTGTSGNVGVDPLYTDDSLTNAVYWDLRLQATSPVRNSGNPSSSYNDADGTYAAIGAYGGPYGDDW